MYPLLQQCHWHVAAGQYPIVETGEIEAESVRRLQPYFAQALVSHTEERRSNPVRGNGSSKDRSLALR